MSGIRLKPCECGTKVRIFRGFRTKFWYIKCPKCQVVYVFSEPKDKEQVIKEWNDVVGDKE